jgi:hypothetical protein
VQAYGQICVATRTAISVEIRDELDTGITDTASIYKG